jgi:hypothetical protein
MSYRAIETVYWSYVVPNFILDGPNFFKVRANRKFLRLYAEYHRNASYIARSIAPKIVRATKLELNKRCTRLEKDWTSPIQYTLYATRIWRDVIVRGNRHWELYSDIIVYIVVLLLWIAFLLRSNSCNWNYHIRVLHLFCIEYSSKVGSDSKGASRNSVQSAVPSDRLCNIEMWKSIVSAPLDESHGKMLNFVFGIPNTPRLFGM